ncbi:proline-rich transmembrane protein 1-like isoform X2 [Patiria miniata]|uniref:Uncharacterized protein n=1 Tax=Patiria miniata TaxID=46514 RepID=A0A913ZNB0_PATMI|nr:proline-rich transmembrane protein 1-like isoform X2 [Patiria miniata]
MSTGYHYKQLLTNENDADEDYGPPPEYTDYPKCPPGDTEVQVVAPRPQTIISTPNVCQPNDYFGLALFVTACCCLPLGIVGLIKANDVRNRFRLGDIAGAEQASREARKYSFWGLGIGIVVLVGTMIATILLVIMEINAIENLQPIYEGTN